MMKKSILILTAGALMLRSPSSTDSAKAADIPAGDQATVANLVIANRLLASPEMNVMDTWTHISARSRTSPNHYFISRSLMGGRVTAADIIENDLASNRVNGASGGQFEERFIDSEIYKARPDVMAVVHMHTPELVVFSVSSVPFRSNGGPIPIFDIRAVNKGVPDLITNQVLGKALAESLGKGSTVLMSGDGVTLAEKSIEDVALRANGLKRSAENQMFAIGIGGQINYGPRRTTLADEQEQTLAPAQATNVQGITGGSQSGGVRGRESWKAMIAARMAAHPNPPPAPAKITSAIEELVAADKILSSTELGILDTLGHVSMRNPANPNHFFITRYIAAARATPQDVIEEDLDCNPSGGHRNDQYQEVYIHCAAYRWRPDIMAVVHAHTPELVAFGQNSVTLRPVLNSVSFIGDGLPVFDVRPAFNTTRTVINNPDKGKAMMDALGKRAALILPNHGVVVVGDSLKGLVSRTHELRLNAQVQQKAILLGGKINYVTPPSGAASGSISGDASTAAGNSVELDRAWDYWREKVQEAEQ